MTDYLPVLFAVVFGMLLATVLLLLSTIGVIRDYDVEKLSPYECGFEPFEDTRKQFEVRFYLIAILFIIFDLEVVFLFPWAVSLGSLGLQGLLVMYFFLLVLTIGFIYEWMSGALDWE